MQSIGMSLHNLGFGICLNVYENENNNEIYIYIICLGTNRKQRMTPHDRIQNHRFESGQAF